MTNPPPELDLLLDALPTDEATLLVLKYVFTQVAELQADSMVHTRVLGAICGRLGIDATDLEQIARGKVTR